MIINVEALKDSLGDLTNRDITFNYPKGGTPVQSLNDDPIEQLSILTYYDIAESVPNNLEPARSFVGGLLDSVLHQYFAISLRDFTQNNQISLTILDILNQIYTPFKQLGKNTTHVSHDIEAMVQANAAFISKENYKFDINKFLKYPTISYQLNGYLSQFSYNLDKLKLVNLLLLEYPNLAVHNLKQRTYLANALTDFSTAYHRCDMDDEQTKMEAFSEEIISIHWTMQHINIIKTSFKVWNDRLGC